jgi:hypothetical protein
MAEEVKRIEVDSDANMADVRNPIFPFRFPFFWLCKRYVVGTDFTSGDSLRIDIDGAQEIKFAVAKTPSNTFLTIAETDLATETSDATRQGKSLTTGTSTTDIQFEAIVRV